jgi:uncharacterized protein (DUF4415 family)
MGMVGRKHASRGWTDPDDAPELTDDWFAKADLYIGERLVRRGGRPRKAAPKVAVNIRLDPDVLAHFRGGGRGWQSRINAALRKAIGLS